MSDCPASGVSARILAAALLALGLTMGGGLDAFAAGWSHQGGPGAGT
jgi:hypothetical protein